MSGTVLPELRHLNQGLLAKCLCGFCLKVQGGLAFIFFPRTADSLGRKVLVLIRHAVYHTALTHNEFKYFVVITASTVFFFIIQSVKFFGSLTGWLIPVSMARTYVLATCPQTCENSSDFALGVFLIG